MSDTGTSSGTYVSLFNKIKGELAQYFSETGSSVFPVIPGVEFVFEKKDTYVFPSQIVNNMKIVTRWGWGAKEDTNHFGDIFLLQCFPEYYIVTHHDIILNARYDRVEDFLAVVLASIKETRARSMNERGDMLVVCNSTMGYRAFTADYINKHLVGCCVVPINDPSCKFLVERAEGYFVTVSSVGENNVFDEIMLNEAAFLYYFEDTMEPFAEKWF